MGIVCCKNNSQLLYNEGRSLNYEPIYNHIDNYKKIIEKKDISLLKIKLPYCIIFDKNMKSGFFINMYFNLINYFDNYSDINFIVKKVHQLHCYSTCECNKENVINKYINNIDIKKYLLLNNIKKKEKNINLKNVKNYYYLFDKEFIDNNNFDYEKYFIKLNLFLSNKNIFIYIP